MPRSSGVWVAGAILALVVGLGGVGWWLRGGLTDRQPEPTEISPEAAASAEAKLRLLQERGDTVRLSEVELSSLLRFRAPASASETVRDPAVDFRGDTLEFSGRVPLDRLPPHPDLDRIRLILPDTAPVVVQGRLRPLSRGRVALQVGAVRFSGIPVPNRYFPAVLERLGRRDEPGLGAGELALPLPPGVGAARVQDERLLLTP